MSKPFNPNLPSTADVTSQQLNALLMSVSTLYPGLLSTSPVGGAVLEGEARAALEVTFMAICDRIDKLLSEDRRWTLDQNEMMEALFLKVYEKNLEAMTAQAEAAKAMRSPAYLYRPALLPTTDGKWAAVLGDITKPETCLIGVGDTPEMAYQAFDILFTQQQPAPDLTDVPLDATIVPQPEPPKSTKKKKR